MTKNRSRIIKLALLLFFVLMLLFIKDPISQYFLQKPNQPFSLLKKDKVAEILITKVRKISSLYKKEAKWYIKMDNQEYAAAEELISKIIESFVGIKKDEIVSNNKSKHKELGIGDKKIELKVDGKSYVIYIGNTSGIANNYIRLDNEDNVYVTSGFDSVFTTEDYRDLLVHLISAENKITSIEINFADKKVKLIKKDKDWKIGNKTAKKDRVDFYLNDLKTLKASTIQPKDFVPRGAVALTIKIKENNKEKAADFLINDTDSYNLKISGSKLIYQIPAAYVGSLKKEEKDFLE